MLFTTTQQQEEIRKTVREFAETEIKPIAFMLDKEMSSRVRRLRSLERWV